MTMTKDAVAQRFMDLVEVMARLRAPGGCPWDIKQTHETLKKYLLEESYELLESIDEADDPAMTEELGDVLLQVVFHAQIARDEGRFTIFEVLDTLCNKLVRRHPHVFGDRVANTADEVLSNWEADKRKEKPERESVLDGVPKMLPALMRAHEIQKKAAKVGFDWDHTDQVFDKVEEEIAELRQAYRDRDQSKINEEMGDLFFALVNLARYLQADSEQSLQNTNRKFISRFQYIEKKLKERGKTPSESTLEEMDALWEEAKTALNGKTQTGETQK